MSGSSIEDFIKKLKGCHEERIRQLANTIGTIWSTTGESSNISGNLTQQIRDLKNIPSNTDDIDTGKLNKLIGLLKQTVQKNELTNSYKNLRNSIETYAKKIECPPEQEDEPIDKAIKYLNEFAETRKDSEMIIDNIILIYTIISKIYYNTLYPKAGKRKNRTNNVYQSIALGSGSGALFSNINNDEISKYVKKTLKAMSKSNFIQGFFNNNNELKSYSYTDTGTYPIISYETIRTKKTNAEIEEFIKQIEIVFDYLKNVEKKEYDAYVEKKGTEAKKFFDKILLIGIGTEYRLGTLFKTGWRKGFGEFHDIVRGRLFPTEKALNRSSRMPRRTPQPKGIKPSRRTQQSRVTQPPKMTRNIKGDPPVHSPPRGKSGYAKPPPGIPMFDVNKLKRDETIRLHREKAKRQGRRKPGWNSSNNREDFTKDYRDGNTKRSNMKRTYGGGNKTRKKKRKKRNTTRNKKRHKKKKHKTRYKKRKKMKQTRKNK